MTDNPEANGAEKIRWKRASKFAIVIGAVGLVVLFSLSAYGIGSAFFAPPDTGCRYATLKDVVATKEDNPGIGVRKLQPNVIERDKSLCIEVDNVLPEKKLKALQARLDVANQAASNADLSHQAAIQALIHTPTPQAQAQADAASAAANLAQSDQAAAQAMLDEALKPRTIVLYLNGKASPLTAQARPINVPQTLQFSITAPQDAGDASASFWRDLLSQPIRNGKIPLRVSVAEQGQPAPIYDWAEVQDTPGTVGITFLLYTPWIMGTAFVSLLAILIGLVGLAYDTALLRTGRSRANSYSLSLVQMALWLVLTTAGFLYIWVVTGQCLGLITPGIFALIGISGATASVAQAIDYSQSTIPKSSGFIRDIVGDWDGGQVQLQRIQIIVWTLILAGIFLWNVLTKLTLTSFDANLLVLTGIANSVYVSLKPQESKPPPETAKIDAKDEKTGSPDQMVNPPPAIQATNVPLGL